MGDIAPVRTGSHLAKKLPFVNRGHRSRANSLVAPLFLYEQDIDSLHNCLDIVTLFDPEIFERLHRED